MAGSVQSERQALLAGLAKAVRKGGMMIYWDHGCHKFAHMKQKDTRRYRHEMFTLRDCMLDGRICHVEEGKKLKLGDVRLYPLLFEFNGKKCDAQRLFRCGKIRKQNQQSLTPYFFRDRETRALVFHWLTARADKKAGSSLEEGGDSEKMTSLRNGCGSQKMFLNNNKIRGNVRHNSGVTIKKSKHHGDHIYVFEEVMIRLRVDFMSDGADLTNRRRTWRRHGRISRMRTPRCIKRTKHRTFGRGSLTSLPRWRPQAHIRWHKSI